MKPTTTLAFDVYGTLIDTSGVQDLLTTFCGEKAEAVTTMWRNKQLEYSFRQTAMGMYKGFAFCTQAALNYSLDFYKLQLSDANKQQLLQKYNQLPAFDDVKPSLKALNSKQLFAFSNGESKNLHKLLNHNNLTGLFEAVVSVEDTEHFKPSPEVYAHFNKVSNTQKEQTFLVSSNPFDIIGAKHYGFKSIWVQRHANNIFDQWGVNPDYIVHSLSEILELEI